MAHIIKLTKVSDGANLMRVENFESNVTMGQTYDTIPQLPITARNAPIAGAVWAEHKFDWFVSGSGVAGTAPVHDLLYTSSGCSGANSPGTSETYVWDGELSTNLVLAQLEASIGNGLRLDCPNAVSDITFEYLPGQPLRASGVFMGTYVAPTEAAITDTLGTTANPVAAKALVCTLNSDTLIIKRITTALNNQNNAPNLDIVGTNGVSSPSLVDTQPRFTIEAIMPAFSVANYYTDYLAGTKMDFSCVLGTVAGNILTTTASLYLNDQPEEIDINGELGARLQFDVGFGSGDTKLTKVFT